MLRLQILICSLLAPVPSTATGLAFQETSKTGQTWSQSELEDLAKRIEGEVEELRGAKFVRPVPVRIATHEDLREFVRKYFEVLDPPERRAADETIAKL